MSLGYGSLFSGIGGIDLGLDRAGMTCRWQVEIDPFCRRVLAKHWPGVPRYEDVREVGAHNLEPVDLICGGFPCQDISTAGKGAGIEGKRSGLWSEFARVIGELRPQYALMENVSALLVRGLGTVLGDLATLGYDAEWDCIPAAALGAPHQRDRVFILAYSAMHGGRHEAPRTLCGPPFRYPEPRLGPVRGGVRRGHHQAQDVAWNGSTWRHNGGRAVQPLVVGMADGVSAQLDRLHALGNAVVPQVAEWIGRQISSSPDGARAREGA